MLARYTPLKFEDGFEISIQASSSAYCSPRRDETLFGYLELELGFPSEVEELITPYSECKYDGIDYTKQVYPYVPSQVVAKLIEKHGNIVSGSHPVLRTRPERIWIRIFNEDSRNIHVVNLSKIEDEYERSLRRRNGVRFEEFLERFTNNYQELSNDQFDKLQKFVDEL